MKVLVYCFSFLSLSSFKWQCVSPTQVMFDNFFLFCGVSHFKMERSDNTL